MAWRSNPLVYAGFYSQKAPLTWDEHDSWWRSRNEDWREYIIDLADRPVGIVTVGNMDHWAPEVGWAIGEVSLWGKGVGKEAVKYALSELVEAGYQYARTTILDNNGRSIRLAKSLGFHKVGSARKGESWYQIKLY